MEGEAWGGNNGLLLDGLNGGNRRGTRRKGFIA
jgi:hypothetical protein